MLSSHSALLESGGNFKYDIKNDVLYTIYDNKTYYMVQAVLYDKYNPTHLLYLVKDLKRSLGSSVIISGGALFNADGHKQGINESIYMTILSILLSAIILLTAFRKKSILYLMTTIIFSLILGLAGCIFIFGTIHILSIIVSASLIGLVVDFSLHWLANNQNKVIKSSSIKLIVKYLIVNFIITAVGYMLFMFSFMLLLQQIAVISIITLFASLLYTIFFLPYILDGAYYTTSNIFNKIFHKYLKSIDFLMSYRLFVLLITAVIIIAGSIKLITTSNFSDNIKNYSSINKDFLHDTIIAGDITGMKNPSNYLVIDNYTIDNTGAVTHTNPNAVSIYSKAEVDEIAKDTNIKTLQWVYFSQSLGLEDWQQEHNVEVFEQYKVAWEGGIGVNDVDTSFRLVGTAWMDSAKSRCTITGVYNNVLYTYTLTPDGNITRATSEISNGDVYVIESSKLQ